MANLVLAARRLAGLAPPPLRRAASGLYSDLRSLPGRLAEPSRWSDPWAVVHNVGGGDYHAVGQQLMAELIAYGRLHPDHQVLDIGCGVGRIATPLADYLSAKGGYVGFDVSRRAIDFCGRRVGRRRPDFRFIHADIRNRDYNAAGQIAEVNFRFPVQSGSIDLAFAASVFSHMSLDAIAHNLDEATRALGPDGRFLFTAFVLTPERRQSIAAGATSFALVDWGAHAMVLDRRSPERLIAHDEAALLQAIAAAGLELEGPWLQGGWAPGPTYPGGQDLFVVKRRRPLDMGASPA